MSRLFEKKEPLKEKVTIYEPESLNRFIKELARLEDISENAARLLLLEIGRMVTEFEDAHQDELDRVSERNNYIPAMHVISILLARGLRETLADGALRPFPSPSARKTSD